MHKNKLIDVGLIIIEYDADILTMFAGCFSSSCSLGYVDRVSYSKSLLKFDDYNYKGFLDASDHFQHTLNYRDEDLIT